MAKRKAKPPAADELRIEYVPLDEIHRDPNNPKDHDLGALAESLERFGFVAPMGMNEETGQLLWGHGRLDRLEQARIAGEDPPARIKVRKDGMWLAPVVRGVSLDQNDGQAYVVADNRQVELGGWNEALLADRLVALMAESTGLKGTGFDADDVDALVRVVGRETDWFDASKIDGVPDEVEGADTKAYLIAVTYISFEDADTFARGLRALTFGERDVNREGTKYTQIDGEEYLERWEAALGSE